MIFLAASVMYEQSMRLGQESHTSSSISRQAQCLLACINALSLVNENYRWIVRPVIDTGFSENNVDCDKVKVIDGKEVLHYKITKQIEVLELSDIKKEYYIVDARLQLFKFNSGMQVIVHTGK